MPTDVQFRNFDVQSVYDDVRLSATAKGARNFVVEFGGEHSRIAQDLRSQDFEKLLATTRDGARYPIRWINIWNAHEPDDDAREIIRDIGKYYGFSRRLIETIETWDEIKPQVRAMVARRELEKQGFRGKSLSWKDACKGAPGDSENTNGVASAIASSRQFPKPERCYSEAQLMGYKVTHDTLNYTTIDTSPNKFICIGANWLHVRPRSKRPVTGTLIPPYHWAWYALCYDDPDPSTPETIPATVITFHEAPYYDKVPRGENEDTWMAKELQSMRSNTLKVLSQLSRLGEDEYKGNIFEITAVREPLRDALSLGRQQQPLREVHNMHTHTGVQRPLKIPHRASTFSTAGVESPHLEGSSNLFYYLFESYASVIPILTVSREELEVLAARVLQTAVGNLNLAARSDPRLIGHTQSRSNDSDSSDIIPKLYRIGNDLRQLQHLFSSYKILFKSIIDYARHDEPHRLASSAKDRFERLNDRMQLLMLNTIQEHLEEKTSLSDTYFNLTAQKDSQATARLTRAANLLAKLSVFFLPISFITSFFSIQLPDVLDGYTKNTYWGAFGVTAFLSFLSLFFFSRMLMFLSDGLSVMAGRVWWKVAKPVAGMLSRGTNRAEEDEEEAGEEEGV